MTFLPFGEAGKRAMSHPSKGREAGTAGSRYDAWKKPGQQTRRLYWKCSWREGGGIAAGEIG